MRMVFTSQRLESVEAVAKLLAEAGIEVKVSNDRSYKGARRKAFSYRQPIDPDNDPQVWVLKAEDQPKARALLREQGLIETTRHGIAAMSSHPASGSFLPSSARGQGTAPRDRRAAIVMRARVLLLVAIGMVMALAAARAWWH